MADNNKEVVRVLKDVTEEIHQLNKNIIRVAKALEEKQFDELIPPPKGTVHQNLRGTTVLNTDTFEEIYDVWCRVNEDGDAE
jgi:ABC-type enterochelin transport system ATPase subunit